MDQLIPVINKLQDVFATIGSQPIDLPQIAVVGSQSVGKSSVLESIVGKDFLPRGSDIVTRRPLILQLFNTRKNQTLTLSYSTETENLNLNVDESKTEDESPQNKSGADDQNANQMWGEFLHTGKKRYFDFDAIRKEIEKETDRVAPNKAISHQTINLKIYSPHVLNLTLVDLPGMTKVPVGNQPPDIERKIRQLLRSFVTKPRCLILAISAATSDLATSDAIQLAKEVDPKGGRTLGVITKIDLMDQGTNCLNALLNKVIPISLGYVGVVNRSQKDINDGRDIVHARRKELNFFKTHPAYRSVANRCGVQTLSKKLNLILINHIKLHLPQLRQQINNNIHDLENELESYGTPLVADTQNKGALLLQLISKFSDNYNSAIDGGILDNKKSFGHNAMDARGSDLHPKAKGLFGGARILYIFRTEFQQQLGKIKPFAGMKDAFILNSMRNATGIRSPLFIPEMCFENLVRMQIEKLRRPCMNCVDLVYTELRRIAVQCETGELSRFSEFQKALHKCVSMMLTKHVEPSREFVNQLIDTELAYINTNHPDFISMDDAFKQRVSSLNLNRRRASGAHAQQSQVAAAQDNQNPQANRRAVDVNSNLNNINEQKDNSVQGNSKDKDSSIGFFGFGKNKQNKRGQNPNPNPNQNGGEDLRPVQATVNVNPAKRNVNVNMNQRHSLPASQKQQQSHANYRRQMHSLTNATERERTELLVIKKFIHSYFEIVKKNVADLIPKTIMFLLINKTKKRVSQELALVLYKEDQFEQLLSENPEIQQKRKAAIELLQVLQKALTIINDVRDYNMN